MRFVTLMMLESENCVALMNAIMGLSVDLGTNSLECNLAENVGRGNVLVQVCKNVVDSSVKFLESGFEFGLEFAIVGVDPRILVKVSLQFELAERIRISVMYLPSEPWPCFCP